MTDPTPAPRFRRPTERWCTDTAIRLLQIGTREGFALVDDAGDVVHMIEPRDAELLVRAAAILDAYGRRLAASRH